MKIKSIVFTLILSTIIASSAFAGNVEPEKDVATKISQELSKFDLDYSTIENKTLKIRLMINENNEIIVLSTNSTELDTSIKAALNYDKIDRNELVPYKVYIVPVSFK